MYFVYKRMSDVTQPSQTDSNPGYICPETPIIQILKKYQIKDYDFKLH